LDASNELSDRLVDRARVTLAERKEKFQFPPSLRDGADRREHIRAIH